jgi:hypothetical protein
MTNSSHHLQPWQAWRSIVNYLNRKTSIANLQRRRGQSYISSLALVMVQLRCGCVSVELHRMPLRETHNQREQIDPP